MQKRKKIGEYFIEKGLINEDQLHRLIEGAKKEGKYTGELLIKCGFCNEEQLVMSLSDQLNIKYVNLRDTEIDIEAVKLVTRDICETNYVFPISVKNGLLSLAMLDPLNTNVIDQIQRVTNFKVTPLIAIPFRLSGVNTLWLKPNYH